MWSRDWFQRLDQQVTAELDEEKARRETCRRRFRAARRPLVGRLLTPLGNHRPLYLLGLLAVLVAFSALKAPYMDLPFTGWHSLKYNTYVEPAMYMAELNDPLHYEQRYQARPLNPRGISSDLGNLPVLEWGLYATYETLPFGLEVETRLFTHVVGVLTLIFAFLFLRYWLPKALSLLTVLLLALNPIFAFSTFVTVYDNVTILCTFISLWALTLYGRNGDLRALFWAGVVAGVGVAAKYSVFLWLAPIGLVLLGARSRDFASFFRDAVLYLAVAALPVLATQTAVTRLLSEPLFGGLMLVGWAAIHAAVFWMMTRRVNWLDSAQVMLRRPAILLPVAMVLLVVAVWLFRALDLQRLAGGYLTEARLIFEPKLYKFMLLAQFRSYATSRVFWIAAAVIPLLVFFRHATSKMPAIAFGVGSIVYWVVASKAIFFHDYYTVIVMATISLGAAVVIYYLLGFGPRILRLALGVGVVALVLPGLLRESRDLLSRHEDISQLTEYITANTAPSDLVLHEGYYSAAAIYTGRGLVRSYRLIGQGVRERAQEVGLGNALQEAGIRFLYTPEEQPSYRDFVPVLVDTKVRRPAYDRAYLICRRVGLDCPELQVSHEELDRLVEVLDIPSQFRLVDTVGKFRIFSFGDSVFGSASGSNLNADELAGPGERR